MKRTWQKSLAGVLAAVVLLSGCSSVNTQSSSASNSSVSSSQMSSETSTASESSSSSQASEQQEQAVLQSEGMLELSYAKNFSVELYQDGYRMITAGNPSRRFLIVPQGMEIPESLEEDVQVLQQPIQRVYIDSTSMVSLIDAIGGLDRVKLVATEEDGWYLENVIEKMQQGEILYSGSYSEPDYEMMAQNEIQLHIDNTMIDGNPEVLEKFQELGIPSLVENSSQESSPLGRVEWVKLFGVLFGMEQEAQEYFDQQKSLVEELSAAESTGKTVAMGYITSSGKCYARNGGDYMAQMIQLAGGEYILAQLNAEKSGNNNLTFEEWYASFQDADYLFYVNMGNKFYSLQEMIDYNPLFEDFKAVQQGNVFVTSPDFTQSTAAIGSIIADMNTILTSDDGQLTTDHLIRLA